MGMDDELQWAISNVAGFKTPPPSSVLKIAPLIRLRNTSVSLNYYYQIWKELCDGLVIKKIPYRPRSIKQMTDDEFVVFITSLINKLEHNRNLLIKLVLAIGNPESLQATVDISIISLIANSNDCDVMAEVIDERSHLMQMIIQIAIDIEQENRKKNLDMILEHS